jgi:anti-sigma factor RsiW
MSTCLKQATLQAFVDRELPSAEMETAERHVAACAVCQQQLDGIRETNLKVNALLSSLAPENDPAVLPCAVIRISPSGVNARMHWLGIASIGVLAAACTCLFLVIRRPHAAPAPTVAAIQTPAAASTVAAEIRPTVVPPAPVHVVPPKPRLKVRQFQALDDGEPMQTGMIFRVNLPAVASPGASVSQSAKRIPAEVIVDEFGNVRAIRFLQ